MMADGHNEVGPHAPAYLLGTYSLYIVFLILLFYILLFYILFCSFHSSRYRLFSTLSLYLYSAFTGLK